LSRQNTPEFVRTLAALLALVFTMALLVAHGDMPWAIVIFLAAFVLVLGSYALLGDRGLPNPFTKKIGKSHQGLGAPFPLSGEDELAISTPEKSGIHHPPTWKSSAALISYLLCILSWELSAVMLAGRRLFGQNWFGPEREWAAFAVSVALSLFYLFIGRPLLQKHYQQGDSFNRSLSGVQAIAVAVVMVAGGAFFAWLFFHEPGIQP
jgi:hypothetical protein